MNITLLQKMIDDIHTKKENKKVFDDYVSERLGKSLMTYQKELNQTVSHLCGRDAVRVMKDI